MQSDYATIRQYRNCQHSNPTAGRPFGTDFSVEDKAQVAIEPKGPDTFQGTPGRLAVTRHGPIARERGPSGQAKQLVDLLRPSQAFMVGDVAVPVAVVRVLSKAGQVRGSSKDEAVRERSGGLLLEHRVEERTVLCTVGRRHRQTMAKAMFVAK